MGAFEAVVTLTRASSEDLLKHASGVNPPVIRAHLREADCDEKRTNQDLVHLSSFSQVPPADRRTWEENFQETDENRELRRRQEEWEKKREGERHQEVSSDSREAKKKKKKKKDKKEKRKSRVKVGGKSIARKNLPDLYSGTGMDPDPRSRKRLKKRR